jgi:hypothetical protein
MQFRWVLNLLVKKVLRTNPLDDPDKYKEIACEGFNIDTWFASTIISLLIGTGIYQKIVLYNSPETPFLNKLLQAIQIMVGTGLAIVASVNVSINHDIDEISANLAALLVITELEHIVGRFFMLYLHKLKPDETVNNDEFTCFQNK